MSLSNLQNLPELPISKPWGWEIEVWRSTDVAITYLHMVEGKSTSLHCHPNKRTGYVVVKGEVEVEFLAGKKHYKAGSRVNFRPCLFHRTKALSCETILLELESPPDKMDLIRLEDSSNRKNSQYEVDTTGISSNSSLRLSLIRQALHNQSADFLQINDIGVAAKSCLSTPRKILDHYNDSIILSPADKGISVKNLQQITGNKLIIQPGDVTTVGDLRRMSSILDIDNEMNFLLLNFNYGRE
jgi:mannose-6-phosphate isomerase-like protein (cupin superfamily)